MLGQNTGDGITETFLCVQEESDQSASHFTAVWLQGEKTHFLFDVKTSSLTELAQKKQFYFHVNVLFCNGRHDLSSLWLIVKPKHLN